MFLDGQKLHTYIPMAKARGFTGAVDKAKEGNTYGIYKQSNK